MKTKKSTTGSRKTVRKPAKRAEQPTKKGAHASASAHKTAKSAPTTLLEKQHREVERMFAQLEGGRVDAELLLTDLADHLAAHMAIEQQIYYPAVRKVDLDLVFERYEEHSLAELALKRLLSTHPRHEAFRARVTAVKELIGHHVDEEEGDLFPQADRALDPPTLADLGKQMEERFAQVLKGGFRAAVPDTYEETSADVSKQ